MVTGDWDLSGSLGCSGPRTGIWRVRLQPCRLTEDIFYDGISRLARSGDLGTFVVDKSVLLHFLSCSIFNKL